MLSSAAILAISAYLFNVVPPLLAGQPLVGTPVSQRIAKTYAQASGLYETYFGGEGYVGVAVATAARVIPRIVHGFAYAVGRGWWWIGRWMQWYDVTVADDVKEGARTVSDQARRLQPGVVKQTLLIGMVAVCILCVMAAKR